MSDFDSAGWGLYVAVLTVVSIIACGALLYAMGRMRIKRAKAGEPTETTGHVWDGDLVEYNNPLPRWWMWLFYMTIVFALVYLILYPGLGTSPGVLHWTSTGAYTKEVREFDAKLAPVYARYLQMDAKAVAADPEARAMGERLFLNYCAQCHGSDARGGKGFPNLTDKDWLHGGTPDKIVETITKGRTNTMPAHKDFLGEPRVHVLAAYIYSLSHPEAQRRVAEAK